MKGVCIDVSVAAHQPYVRFVSQVEQGIIEF